jgi:hypothetical protein
MLTLLFQSTHYSSFVILDAHMEFILVKLAILFWPSSCIWIPAWTLCLCLLGWTFLSQFEWKYQRNSMNQVFSLLCCHWTFLLQAAIELEWCEVDNGGCWHETCGGVTFSACLVQNSESIPDLFCHGQFKNWLVAVYCFSRCFCTRSALNLAFQMHLTVSWSDRAAVFFPCSRLLTIKDASVQKVQSWWYWWVHYLTCFMVPFTLKQCSQGAFWFALGTLTN